MIKIETKTTQIPIEFGDDLTLYFDMSDESIEQMIEAQEVVEKEIGEVKEDVEGLKELLKKAYSLLLGDEAFDKLYELSPSVIILNDYFWSIVEGLQIEIEKRSGKTRQQKIEKYLNKKK